MKHFRGYRELIADRAHTPRHTVVTIGNFDGVHLGHREILERLKRKAIQTHGLSLVYTFRPHPQEVLRPGTDVKLITTYDEKTQLLESAGIDLVVEEPFSQDFFTLSAREFFDRILVQGFQAKHLFVGHDFAFGRNREGDFAQLSQWCAEAGIEIERIEPFCRLVDPVGKGPAESVTVSSSRIRKALLEGDVAMAAKMLGGFFFYRGTVMKGDQRGRLLGFPTANLRIENKLALPNGVYATWAILKRKSGHDEKIASVTNVGVRPTFYPEQGALPKVVETHLILPAGEFPDLYGETLEVQFAERFRDEKKFGSIDELKAQIAIDREHARAFFGATNS